MKKKEILSAYYTLINSNKKVSLESMMELGISRKNIRTYFHSLSGLETYAKKSKNPTEALQKEKEEIIRDYLKTAKDSQSFPTLEDLSILTGKKGTHITSLFGGSISKLKEVAKQRQPKALANCIDYSTWTSDRLSKLQKKIENTNTFFITTVLGGASIHKEFLDTIRAFCKKHNAELLILVADNDLENIPSEIIHENIIYSDVELCSGLFISNIKIRGKQINPQWGLDQLSYGGMSCIYASPKQHLQSFARLDSNDLPRVLMSTGTLSQANYHGSKYIAHRTDTLATMAHKIGGLIVKTRKDGSFDYTQVQSTKSGGFYHLGNYYEGSSIEYVGAKKLVLGDIHITSFDDFYNDSDMQQWDELRNTTNCEELILHDLFDGYSINPHESYNFKTLVHRANDGRLSLRKELEECADRIKHLLQQWESIVVVRSNHDVFLDRWLSNTEHLKDPHNFTIGMELFHEVLQGNNPLEYFIRKQLNIQEQSKIKFLGISESYRYAGIELGQHGHKGANGSKGSHKQLEKHLNNAVHGHTHVPAITRDTWSVGFAGGRHEYAVGLSSWMKSSCLIYPGGYRQLINIVNGKIGFLDK